MLRSEAYTFSACRLPPAPITAFPIGRGWPEEVSMEEPFLPKEVKSLRNSQLEGRIHCVL